MPVHAAGLASVIHEFVAALGDHRVVERFFAPGDQTLLSRDGCMVVGFGAVLSSVRTEPLAAPIRLVQTHLREIGPDTCVVTAAFAGPTGRRGVMTLVWQLTDRGWRIVSAQVDTAGPPVDPAVWREVGTPLEPALGRGPLDRVGLALADVFSLAGHRIGVGTVSGLDAGIRAGVTAAPITTLQQAGADVVGIARVDELAIACGGANPHSGTPRNIRAPDRFPGGAMSGPVAAVTRGHADLAVGTDAGGSLRIPASYQGLYALTTTPGAVGIDGLVPLCPTFDALGLAARDIDVIARAARVLMPDAGRRTVDEIVVPAELAGLADPDVVRAVDQAVERWDSTRLPIRVASRPLPDPESWVRLFRTIRGAELAAAVGEWAEDHWDELGPAARSVLRHPATTDQVAAARADLVAARARISELVGGGVLVLPTTASVAPSRDPGPGLAGRAEQRTAGLVGAAGVGGLPVVSIPLSTRRRLPCGVSLVGPVGSDHALVDLAAAVDRTGG